GCHPVAVCSRAHHKRKTALQQSVLSGLRSHVCRIKRVAIAQIVSFYLFEITLISAVVRAVATNCFNNRFYFTALGLHGISRLQEPASAPKTPLVGEIRTNSHSRAGGNSVAGSQL